MIPSLFPLFDPRNDKLYDGGVVTVSSFCVKTMKSNPECKQHYASLSSKPEGYYQCPAGFTTRVFYFRGELWMITGVVAWPRFDTSNERAMAKCFPDVKISREAIDKTVDMFKKIDDLRGAVIQEAAKVFPQAFHELRKLNGAIIQNAEKELKSHSAGSPTFQTILSAAELMRNNFDILEALSNIEGMRALPSDSSINVFDLIYKTKRVLTERAKYREMSITLGGVRAIIKGSPKSFPIVPAVLIENAIKYGKAKSGIKVDVDAQGKFAVIIVENETDLSIDSEKCFEKGSRYAGNTVEGGGFGLFLAKEIVLAHQGAIRCETPDGKVRMIVELPLEKVIPM